WNPLRQYMELTAPQPSRARLATYPRPVRLRPRRSQFGQMQRRRDLCPRQRREFAHPALGEWSMRQRHDQAQRSVAYVVHGCIRGKIDAVDHFTSPYDLRGLKCTLPQIANVQSIPETPGASTSVRVADNALTLPRTRFGPTST